MYYGRSRLHRALLGAATASTGSGVPVEVHLGTEVVSVDTQAARVVLGDGRVFEGDAVVGADGFYVGPARDGMVSLMDRTDFLRSQPSARRLPMSTLSPSMTGKSLFNSACSRIQARSHNASRISRRDTRNGQGRTSRSEFTPLSRPICSSSAHYLHRREQV
jgi:hypothetical protein